MCFCCSLWTYFTPCSSVSIVNFQQVNACWFSAVSCFHKKWSIIDGWVAFFICFSCNILDLYVGWTVHWEIRYCFNSFNVTGFFLYLVKKSEDCQRSSRFRSEAVIQGCSGSAEKLSLIIMNIFAFQKQPPKVFYKNWCP